MSKQVLLCVESNKQSQTDYTYIKSAIERFYLNDRKIIYRPIFLGSKNKYNAKSKEKEIESWIKRFSGETYVIYFIDIDNIQVNNETQILNKKIEAYCKEKEYDLVFFCRDVEEVFTGKSVSNGEKVKAAANFRAKGMIKGVKEEKLRVKSLRRNCSNLLNVLDKYWKAK